MFVRGRVSWRLRASLFTLLPFAFSALSVAQDSFMVRFSSASYDGVVLNRGDFNNDGIPDIIMGNNSGSDGSAVGVYLGKGDGTLQSALDSAAATAAFDITVGDFNRDGKLDVAIGGLCQRHPGRSPNRAGQWRWNISFRTKS